MRTTVNIVSQCNERVRKVLANVVEPSRVAGFVCVRAFQSEGISNGQAAACAVLAPAPRSASDGALRRGALGGGGGGGRGGQRECSNTCPCLGTVAILAQGTSWAAAVTQAFFLRPRGSGARCVTGFCDCEPERQRRAQCRGCAACVAARSSGRPAKARALEKPDGATRARPLQLRSWTAPPPPLLRSALGSAPHPPLVPP